MSGDEAKKTGAAATVPGGRLAPWTVGELPPAPAPGWRLWIGLLGPGVVLAGTSIGSGEWLFGPAVSAQYGGTLLWLATMSIVLQVFCNLMMMRYTLYCGEPIIVGGFRTAPGPKLWFFVYLVLDVAAIWPYNASNAAVPLAAAVLGHLPGESNIRIFGWLLSEAQLVRALGFTIFTLCFVPLIFGGTVYRMLEKIMSIKLVLVLGYLTFMAVFFVSPRVGWEVVTGFFRFGVYPQRADTIVVGRPIVPGNEAPTQNTATSPSPSARASRRTSSKAPASRPARSSANSLSTASRCPSRFPKRGKPSSRS